MLHAPYWRLAELVTNLRAALQQLSTLALSGMAGHASTHLLEHLEGTLVLRALWPLPLRFCRVAGARGPRLCLRADWFHDWEPGQHVCRGCVAGTMRRDDTRGGALLLGRVGRSL